MIDPASEAAGMFTEGATMLNELDDAYEQSGRGTVYRDSCWLKKGEPVILTPGVRLVLDRTGNRGDGWEALIEFSIDDAELERKTRN